jgi:hypothetical protein
MSQAYVIHGWPGIAAADNEFRIPIQVDIYLDGEKLQLNQLSYTEGSGEYKTYSYLFYQYFEPLYFEPGIHNWTVVWSSAHEVLGRRYFPLTVADPGHHLNIWRPDDTLTITTSQRCYFRHGWKLYRDGFDSLPVNVQLYIDGEEIDLQLQTNINWTDEENPLHYWLFFKDFEPRYFEPGSYVIRVIYSTSEGVAFDLTETLTVLDDGHRLSVFLPPTMEISTSDQTFVRHWFWPMKIEELETKFPFGVQLFIDGNEIPLEIYTTINWEAEGGPDYWWWFYKSFPPEYFEPGIYEWVVVFTTNDGGSSPLAGTLIVNSP